VAGQAMNRPYAGCALLIAAFLVGLIVGWLLL
jgi:F0F1-type ATP synthase assembly protein I